VNYQGLRIWVSKQSKPLPMGWSGDPVYKASLGNALLQIDLCFCCTDELGELLTSSTYHVVAFVWGLAYPSSIVNLLHAKVSKALKHCKSSKLFPS